MEKNELMVNNVSNVGIDVIGDGVLSSYVPTNLEEKKKFFNMINSSSQNVSDFINKKIKLQHIYIEYMDIIDDETGEVNNLPVLTLIDENLQGYTCVSIGMISAIKKLVALLGHPKNWEKPLEIEIKQVKVKRGSMLTFSVVV